MCKPLRIGIQLPYLFSVRDFIFTPVWKTMNELKDVEFFLLCPGPTDQYAAAGESDNVTFLAFPPKRPRVSYHPRRFLGDAGCRGLLLSAIQKFDRTYLYDSLVYRFFSVNDLSDFRIRKEKTKTGREDHRVMGNYAKGERIGYPFPKSKTMFRMLHALRYRLLSMSYKSDLAFLRDLDLDLFVFARLHMDSTASWSLMLKQLSISMIGIVPSLDHTTVQGSTPKGMSGYVVASRQMVEELSGLHGIKENSIDQIGKVQMDINFDDSIVLDRETFLGQLGVPPHHALLTFGANTTGLKEHEVSIVRRLAHEASNGRFGDATLLIRTHPQDANWERDFMPVSNPPYIQCLSANSFGNRQDDSLKEGRIDQAFLANLMRHSNVVIHTRGSISLDAIAFDTPVVSIAFDGDLDRDPRDSVLQEYGWEHMKPLVRAEGTWMVGSYEALYHSIEEYLKNPGIHSEGRRRTREEQIDPLDGAGSRRLVKKIVETARQAQEGALRPGDWSMTGLGDVSWASRRDCRIQDYVDYG